MNLFKEIATRKPCIVPLIGNVFELRYYMHVKDKWVACCMEYATIEDATRNLEKQEVALIVDRLQRFVNLHENIRKRSTHAYSLNYRNCMGYIIKALARFSSCMPSKRDFAFYLKEYIAGWVYSCVPSSPGSNKNNGLHLVEFLNEWATKVLQIDAKTHQSVIN